MSAMASAVPPCDTKISGTPASGTNAPDKSELLRRDGEDRVPYRLGQVRKLFYALPEAPPADASGANGDKRLLYLVAGTLRVYAVVYKGYQAVFDVRIGYGSPADDKRPNESDKQ